MLVLLVSMMLNFANQIIFMFYSKLLYTFPGWGAGVTVLEQVSAIHMNINGGNKAVVTSYFLIFSS